MFVDAADRAEAAWRAAQRVRLAGLDPDQRAAIERAIELLTTAAATDNEAERLLAYARARVELAHLERSGGLRLPRAARAALAGAARGEPRPRRSRGSPRSPAEEYQGVVRRDPGSFRPRNVAAFSEGRRLREQANRGRRQRGGPQPAGARRRSAVAARLAPGVMLLFWLLLLSTLARAGHGGFGFIDPTPLLLIGTVALVTAGGRRRVATRPAVPLAGPLPRPVVAPPRPDLAWSGARERFHALRAEYAAFECDPMGVLRLPALADVAVPSTARFVDAFAEAQALETDAYPGPGHADRFAAAADRAERSWRAAVGAAERIRLSGLAPAERATVERVVKLLTTARDSDSEPERLAAYARARSELAKLDRAGVLHMPLPAQTALDEAARGALPG